MKKAFGQTVRDLKREVNKKVLKVPGIEQKVLDATSNEPWGPHGSLLSDIAMATRNYHEYQMIMAVLWKRINDTGKNWRHVYKALTVLDYLVAHGSERVIDDIREHAYQISNLSNFQYIDSSGRDQGSNVRKKSQSLVALVNDKERIIEVRQKAVANRDKFQNTSAAGMYRPGSGGYGDRYDYDRYGSKEEYQNGYGRDREYGYRDDDQYGRYGDSNSGDGDRYGRGDYEDRYSRDGYRDDDYRGRSRSVDDDQYGTNRSSDRDCAFDDDGASSRGSGARADDHSQDGRKHERKFSEQNIGAPPSYEEAVSESRSPVHSERDGEISVAAAPRVSSPSAGNNPNQAASDFGNSASPPNQKVEAFDEFDPRGSVSAASTVAPAATPTAATAVPIASTSAEIDLLGTLSDSLAVVPTIPTIPAGDADAHAKSVAIPTFAANQSAPDFGNQGFDDPFGDGPFKAFPSTDAGPSQLHISTSMPTFQPTLNQNAEVPQPPSAKSETVTDFNFGDSFSANPYSGLSVSSVQPPSANSQFLPQELSTPNQETDILADILPPSGPADDVASFAAFSSQTSQSATPVATYGQSAQPGIYGQQAQPGANMYSQPTQPSANPYGQPAQPSTNPYGQPGLPSSNAYGQSAQPSVNPYGPPAQLSANPYGQPAQAPANPYDQPAQPNANPYSQPMQQNASPYGQHVQPNANPYAQPTQPSSNNTYDNFYPQTVSMTPQIPGSAAQSSNGSIISQIGSNAPVSSHMAAQPQNPAGPAVEFNTGNVLPQQGSVVPVALQSAHQSTKAPGSQNNNDALGGLFSPPGSTTSMVLQTAPPSSTGALAIVPLPSKDKFEPKSAVWADTLSRGLVNLNISGPKINPLADIGVDFDAINRKEKRMEKPAQTAVTSTITMGKAMGSGSGIGRAGASVLRPPANPMMGSGMGMGMGMGMGVGPVGGMGMGGYGGMNQQPIGMGMGMGMNNMSMNPGMAMNMGMGQGAQMQPQTGMPGSYNPMMGSGGYSQQPYGGGHR
ncbi:clathrin interactor EPSIN 3-like isoform X2 [Durio zibethinus]|uniref:Clathrin interactor EPSIN 3-like isoform X2 n=1 Tax=Durio zibethinus TaxID=66656 RepID=A0A6P5Y4N6_DURZI|nr:clathrin interactor EPSIN 3-like isoform X2 [Durio zibethinus]